MQHSVLLRFTHQRNNKQICKLVAPLTITHHTDKSDQVTSSAQTLHYILNRPLHRLIPYLLTDISPYSTERRTNTTATQ
jgi:hypothetical protein